MVFNCGQLFLTGLDGINLGKEEKEFISEYDLSGVVLFSKNYENKEQLAQLINDIQSCTVKKKIIAVDHEGWKSTAL